MIVVGLDGSPVVEQAHRFLTTGSTGKPEKQSVDCVLVTRENADRVAMFRYNR